MNKTRIKRKPWTFMVYMAGDNNLDPDGIVDLREMKKVGSTDDVNVIAQFDRASGRASKRYYLRKGGTVAKDAVASLGQINTGDPKNLLDFIRWGVKQYPAERCGLVLWNHGQGWDDTDLFAEDRHRGLRRLATGSVRHALFHAPVRTMLKKAVRDVETRAILIDEGAKDFLDNIEMKKVLTQAASLLGKKLDVLGMDACLMSMAEVGYQIRQCAAFTVGSEETEPSEGWPYDLILSELVKHPSMTGKDLGAVIVDKYLASYSDDAVTQSACDLSKADVLASSIEGLAAALKAGLADGVLFKHLLSVRGQVQAYYVRDYVDLVDFCSLLAQAAAGSEIESCCGKVVRAVQSGYVVKQGYKGDDMRHSNGVSIYFPTSTVSPLYSGLDFDRQTQWGSFLTAYTKAIRNR